MNIFTNQETFNVLIHAIGGTILHSLWQGLILALVGGMILVFGKDLRPAKRYLLLVGALTLFLVATGITFVNLLGTSGADAQESAAGKGASTYPIGIWENRLNLSDLFERAAYAFDSLSDYYGIIVLSWFMVVCIKGIRMSAGIYAIYRLRSTGISSPAKQWQYQVDSICRKLKIQQRVNFFESKMAKVPLVIGHLRPVILFPVGLVNALSVEQVEAILAHELAHVLRRDFLVNLLQSAMEMVFFFNPAVLWVSSLVKAERENCCDDIAVAYTGSKSLYIDALVNCEDYQSTATHLGVALKSSNGLLINRVKRLLNIERSALNLIERVFITTCLFCILFVGLAFAIKPMADRHQPSPMYTVQEDEEPRVQGEKMIAELLDRKLIPDAKNFRLRMTNDALYINGKRQSAEIHSRMLQKYVRNPSQKLNYTTTVKTD